MHSTELTSELPYITMKTPNYKSIILARNITSSSHPLKPLGLNVEANGTTISMHNKWTPDLWWVWHFILECRGGYLRVVFLEAGEQPVAHAP